MKVIIEIDEIPSGKVGIPKLIERLTNLTAYLEQQRDQQRPVHAAKLPDGTELVTEMDYSGIVPEPSAEAYARLAAAKPAEKPMTMEEAEAVIGRCLEAAKAVEESVNVIDLRKGWRLKAR